MFKVKSQGHVYVCHVANNSRLMCHREFRFVTHVAYSKCLS